MTLYFRGNNLKDMYLQSWSTGDRTKDLYDRAQQYARDINLATTLKEEIKISSEFSFWCKAGGYSRREISAAKRYYAA